MASTITRMENHHPMTLPDSSPFCAVVAAGGVGRRFGGGIPKQFQLLSGVPVLIHTLRKFETSPLIARIILALPEERIPWFTSSVLSEFPLSKLSSIVPGGETRQASVSQGLQEVDPEKFSFVAIHDGVRPFFDPQWLEEGYEVLQSFSAVAVGIPPVDTVKRVSSRSFVTRTEKRESLVMIQTPQMFHTRLIRAVHEEAVVRGWSASDDATLMERAGHPVKIIPGSRWNIKITKPEDLRIGEILLAMEGEHLFKRRGER